MRYCFSLILLFIFSFVIPAQELTLLTENYPPYNFQEGSRITGFTSEIVREICRRLNIPDNINLFPWNRAYHMVQSLDNHLLFSVYRTEEREDLFKWVGPILGVDQCLWAFKDKHIQINTIEDAKNFSVVTQQNSNVHLFLMAQEFNYVYPITSKTTREMFQAGRVDLYPSSKISGIKKFREAGILDEVEIVYVLKKDFIYIAFNKNTSDNVIQLWQETLDSILKEPIFDNLYDHYIKPYLEF